MIVGTHTDGRTVTWEDSSRCFRIGGNAVPMQRVIEYSEAGRLKWADDDVKRWAYELVHDSTPKATDSVDVSAIVLEVATDVRSAHTACGRESVTAVTTDVMLRRYLAFAVDMPPVGLLQAAIVLVSLAGLGRSGAAVATAAFLSTVILIGYFGVSETFFNGRTLGKLALGVRVVAEDGSSISLGQGIARSAALLFDALLLGVPAFMSMTSTHLHQRWGDRWAHTAVVRA